MLDLEGTKNERSIVIILSYVIGFVSAYIWLGLSGAGTDQNELALIARDAPPIQTHNDVAHDYARSANGTSVQYENGILSSLHGNSKRMLSLAKSNVIAEEIPLLKSSLGQGVHEDISGFSVSENGMYVFFCENYGSTTCNAYIYDIGNDLIRPVRDNGTIEAIPVEEASRSRWEDGRVVVAEYSSVSSAEPWLVTRR